MVNTRFVLERFQKAEDYPEATEDTLIDYLTDLVNNSATSREEAQEVLLDYLDYLNVDPDSLVVHVKNGHFEVDFPD